MKVWVTMGFFDDRGDGLVVELDSRSGSVREVLRFEPPEGLCVPSKGFTGATWTGAPGQSDLLICGSAAVFRFDATTLSLTGTLALPSFNDLHHITIDGDRIYVANTGMDCIDVFDTQGRFLGSLSFDAAWLAARRWGGETPGHADWDRLHAIGWAGQDHVFTPERPRGSYYRLNQEDPFHMRKQLDYVHPNHVTVFNDRILVTSLVRKGVIDVTSWRQVIHVDSPPHDGFIYEGGFYVTRVDGYVERRDLNDLNAGRHVMDATAFSAVSGWCRGIFVTDEMLWVGFTQLRRGQSRYQWDRESFDNTSTAVVALERRTGKVIRTFDLTDPERHSKVFALLEAA